MEDRYSIRLDENGQPYLAHALFNSGRQGQGTRQNHKYILKIGQGEQARYFYTPEEVRAYYNELKKKASGKVEDAKKFVQNTVKNTAKSAKETKEDIEQTLNQTKQDAVSDIKRTAKNVKSKAEQMREEFRKKDQEKTVAEPLRSKGQDAPNDAATKSMPQSESDWENNRPEGRKRNVTGNADPIVKKSEGVVKGNKEKAAELQKKYEDNNKSMLKLRTQAWAYEDEYYGLEKDLDKLKKNRNDMTTSEYGRKYGEISKKRKELWDKANETWDEFDALWDENSKIDHEIKSMKVER